MANFKCVLCERTYVHKRNLVQHVKTNHIADGERPETRNRPVGESLERPIKTRLGFTCDQCDHMHRRSLDRHVDRSHTVNPSFSCNQCGKSFARYGNMELHKRTCTGSVVAAVPAVE